jgi:hypothetical protein
VSDIESATTSGLWSKILISVHDAGMRLALVVAGSLALVWAAGAGSQRSVTGELRGQVTIGPTAPVCRAGEPCTKPATGVLLTFTHGARRVSTHTDRTTGRYRVTLRAGVWSVRASAGMRIAPALVNIATARVTVRNFLIDTGIR